MRVIPLILLTSITAFGVRNASAQLPGGAQSRQLESVEQRLAMDELAAKFTLSNAPSLFPEEDTDIGPQSVLKIRPRQPRVELFADAQYFYTDNMFLSDRNEQSSDVLVSTVQGVFNAVRFPISGGDFVARVGYRHQWFDYGLADHSTINVFDFNTGTFRQAKLNEFDFNAGTAFAESIWKRDNWVAGLAFDYQRLMDTDSYHEFYRELTPRWGLSRVLPLCSRSVLRVGYEGDYRVTDTGDPPINFDSNFNDRTDHSLVIDATYILCKYAIAQAYYRFQFTHFTGSERREDYLNAFGLALYCPFTQNIGLRFFVNYDILETNGQLVTDYNRLDTGAGLNLTVRF
ncbi:MAG TPA: hypothetical protein VL793_13455 [Patescibacteria group bacterium]|nr:hypothetical protein [Patescibacteria group bacterium]